MSKVSRRLSGANGRARLEQESLGAGNPGAVNPLSALRARAAALPEILAPEDFVALWNILAAAVDVRPCLVLNPARRRSVLARLREHPERSYWVAVFRKIGLSPFCRGCGSGGWRATIDFVLRPTTHLKALEGAYDGMAADAETFRKYWGDLVGD